MYHYIAFIWDAQDATANAAVARFSALIPHDDPNWHCAFAADNLRVFALTPRTRVLREYVLPNTAGLVLGRLFATAGGRLAQDGEPQFRGEALDEELLESYWGSYVAFIRNAPGHSCLIARDCSGRIPCYWTRQDRVCIAFSDVEDLVPLKLGPFSIDPSYLAAFIYCSELQLRTCALRGVSEILAGECLDVRPDVIEQRVFWDPRRVCRARRIVDPDAAIQELRSATARCVGAWASVHDNIVLSLSGGLDSAVVLGCLVNSTARPDLTCVTFFSQTGGDDERAFARIAAGRVGVRLIEHAREETAVFDATLFDLPKTPKPTVPFVFNRRHLDIINAITRARNADAVWTGQGGDHLFFHGGRTSLGAADFIADRGLHPAVLRAVGDAARVSREPYVSVLKAAWSLARSRTSWRPRQVVERRAHFVDERALPADLLAYTAHPWTEDAMDLPKGKQFQIHYLAEVVNRHRPVPHLEYAYEHHPLLSQPVMTVCLQIPTYVLLRGGRQRGLARDAFADIVPREIIEREDKGSTTFYVTDAIRRDSAFIQDLLLDGILVQEKIVRRAALEPYLVQHQSLRLEHVFPLLACIAGEIWIRSWQGSVLECHHSFKNCSQ